MKSKAEGDGGCSYASCSLSPCDARSYATSQPSQGTGCAVQAMAFEGQVPLLRRRLLCRTFIGGISEHNTAALLCSPSHQRSQSAEDPLGNQRPNEMLSEHRRHRG